MKHLAMLALGLLPLAVLASDREALKKMHTEVAPALRAAEAEACAQAKHNTGKHPDLCADEIKAFAAVNCIDLDSRKTIDPARLNHACAERVAAQAKNAAHAPVPCKAIDAAGAVLGEATSEGNSARCQEALNPLVEAKCTPAQAGKMLKYTILSSLMGKEQKLHGVAFCPKAK